MLHRPSPLALAIVVLTGLVAWTGCASPDGDARAAGAADGAAVGTAVDDPAGGADTDGATVDAPPQPADLVLRGGNIVTLADAGQVAALAAAGGRVVAVGSASEIDAYIGPDTEVVELEGRTVVPGFIEGHGHFTGIGDAAQILDLSTARTWDDIVAMVAEAVANSRPGEWIRGRGWHQEKWDSTPPNAVEGFPTHQDVSAVSPDNPVSLTHASGHAAFFNRKAMELAGVTADTPDPAGGEILRDVAGDPIGVFRETAQSLVRRVYSAELLRMPADAKREAARRAIRLADRECLAHGVTSFQDAGSSFRTVDDLHDMAERGELTTRLWVMIRDTNANLAAKLADYRVVDAYDHRLTVCAVKRTLDGALGARGAWLLEPYSDAPESTGLATATVASVEESARLARDAGYQMCVHAIGDRANRETLDLFERAFADHGGGDALRAARWRVEHAQHLHPDDIGRFGSLGVIASMQGIHCTSDAPWIEPRLGARRAEEGAYVWRKLLDSGAVVTNGTDAPVEPIDPLAAFYASVTRKMRDGTPFYPDQRMTRLEALQSYTVAAAWAAFEDDDKGTLAPGMLADLVVLSHDILTCSEDELLDAHVLLTVVGGEVVYRLDD